jgi:Flp pilus assembly protein TadD
MNDEKDLLELGKFYFLNNKFQKAIEIFKRLLKEEKTNYDAMYNLGLSYEALNDVDSAKIFYKQALDIKADHKRAKEHLQRLIGKE